MPEHHGSDSTALIHLSVSSGSFVGGRAPGKGHSNLCMLRADISFARHELALSRKVPCGCDRLDFTFQFLMIA